MRSILASILLVLAATPLAAADLFFSEYIEGSSFNKAIEIYNPTSTPVDLAAGAYRIELHSNGSPTPSQGLNLSGVIAPGEVFVLAHPSADLALLAQTDVTNSSVINWNGDDAVVLRRGGVVIDAVGQIGVDPGSEWGSGLTSTADNTIRRKAAICSGDPIADDPFDPALEWDGFANNTFDGFGSHDASCAVTPPPPTDPDLTIGDVSVTEGNAGATTATFTVTLSAPAGAGGVSFQIATRDGSATAASGDYVARAETAVIAEGASAYAFDVTVNGDAEEESDESFFVDVTAVAGANVVDGSGEATILNDDFASGGTAGELFFSEYIEGASFNKAIEIFNGTSAPIDLAEGGYRLALYSNGNPEATASLDLSGVIAAGDVLVLAHGSASAAIRVEADVTNNSVINWNGDDAIVLFRGTAVIDAIGQVGVDPGTAWTGGGLSTADRTLRRQVSVCAGDTVADDPFDPSLEWDGFPRDTADGLGVHLSGCIPGEPPPPPPPAIATIPQIQGSGDISPYANRMVETFGNVVTAVGPQGFFIQDPTGDGDSATSDGIYVFTGSAPGLAAGDKVDVTGRVVEFFGMTEFSGDVAWSVTGTATVPAPVAIDPGFTGFEKLESMLVQVSGGAAALGTDQFGSTAVVAAPIRPFRAAGDDPATIFEVDPTDLGGDTAHVDIVGGASIHLAEGPLTYSFNDYVIWTTALEYTNPPFPRPVRARAPGEMTVAAQNLLRLFDDVDDPSLNEPVTDSAVYAARLAAWSEHIRNNLGAPDVLAVSEVENQMTLADLASWLNADDASLGYSAWVLEGNDIGGIDVGFLVRSTVQVGSVHQLGADDVWTEPNGSTSILNDRPPLLLRGTYVGNGAPFPIAAIAVHQRSMIDVETNPRVRAKRLEQAHRLAGYVADLRDADPDLRVVVAGDFNAFEFDDGFGDIMGIVASEGGLTNQVFTVPAADRYSYVHDGLAQVLDHALTSAALEPFTRGLQFARRNADAPVLTGRPSDHDGLVVFVMTDHDGDGLADDADACAQGDARPTVILAGCDSGAPNIAFGGGCTLTDRLLDLAAGARNHGELVSAARDLLEGVTGLTGAQRGAIQSCIARFKP